MGRRKVGRRWTLRRRDGARERGPQPRRMEEQGQREGVRTEAGQGLQRQKPFRSSAN